MALDCLIPMVRALVVRARSPRRKVNLHIRAYR